MGNSLQHHIKKLVPASAYGWAKRAKAKMRKNSYKAVSSYTVIAPAFNVEPYIDRFFESIIAQSVVRKSLQVVVVDDGSTDGTAAKVGQWKKRYPQLVCYVKKENGGTLSACNAGMPFAKNTWITFANPDDCIGPEYFEQIDRALRAHSDSVLFVAKRVTYCEDTGKIKNDHPLTSRFSKGDVFYDVTDDAHLPIVVSPEHALFRADRIAGAHLRFDENLSPLVGGANFISDYLLNENAGTVGFLARALYCHRKKRPTVSSSGEDAALIDDLPRQLRDGVLAVLQRASAGKGYVPQNLQSAAMYVMARYLKYCVGRPERTVALTEQQAQQAKRLMEEICTFFDKELLFQQPGKHVGFEQKAAISLSLMNDYPGFQKVFLRRLDLEKKIIHIRTLDGNVRCMLDGVVAEPFACKRVDRTLFGASFFSEFELYYHFDSPNQMIDFCWSETVPTVIDVNGAEFSAPIRTGSIIDEFTKGWDSYRNDNLWIIMDRDTQADDNGEHFYRYLLRNAPEQECYFALRRSSRDWNRLEQEGFNLVDFGSPEFEDLLRRSSVVISSQAEKYTMSYFGDNYHFSKKFVFLQHGVIRCDLSEWLNSKRVVDLMLVSTQGEYDSVVKDGAPYFFSSQEIALTGLPRHDALLEKKKRKDSRPMILVMPTWRKWICGPLKANSNERQLSEEFLGSQFKRCWEEFLGGEYLRGLAESGCRVVFYPHMNIFPYVENGWMEVPKWVEIGSQDGIRSLQDYLVEASAFVTDYSSLMFDAAYAGIPAIYYQFDADEFYSGKHTSTMGYFDDVRDGFGPVVVKAGELEAELDRVVANNWSMGPEYANRIESTFPFRDGRCCERALAAIRDIL